MDNKTNIITYGGSSGGGKSFVGCLWIVTLCLQYPGVRCLIGRAVLAQLKITTLNTLFETLQNMDLKPNEHFVYNAQ
jgi:phage terminase large subunit